MPTKWAMRRSLPLEPLRRRDRSGRPAPLPLVTRRDFIPHPGPDGAVPSSLIRRVELLDPTGDLGQRQERERGAGLRQVVTAFGGPEVDEERLAVVSPDLGHA